MGKGVVHWGGQEGIGDDGVGAGRVEGGGTVTAAAPGLRWRDDTRRTPTTAHRAITAAPLRVERMEVMMQDIPPGKRQLTRKKDVMECVCGERE